MNARQRVLIVDDEIGVRESLRAILEPEYEVLTADTGERAVELFAAGGVDVATLDLKMPGLGGIGVLERAKEHDPDVEVIIITGYGSLDTAIQGLRFHAFDYLAKPFEADHVRKLIGAAAARRAATRMVRQVPEQILSTLSHEFRTPLNVIMGYSSMLHELGANNLSDEQRRALDRIQSNSASLLGYVETIFYMAELDRGRSPVVAGPVRIADALGRVAAELAPRAMEKGIDWRVDVAGDLLVTTDEEMLVRLVRTLADNAVRFTDQGEVVVTVRGAGGGTSIDIRDTGPGLDEALIHETQGVVQGDGPVRNPRLLGFGLRLAGRLIRALAGRLDIEAGPNGTMCRILVPELTTTADAPLHVATSATA